MERRHPWTVGVHSDGDMVVIVVRSEAPCVVIVLTSPSFAGQPDNLLKGAASKRLRVCYSCLSCVNSEYSLLWKKLNLTLEYDEFAVFQRIDGLRMYNISAYNPTSTI